MKPQPPQPQISQSDNDPSVTWNQNFGDKTLINWNEFSPFLSEHFVQTAKFAYRPLSNTDLQVIKEKLETQSPRDKVTLQAFVWLWRWFRGLEDIINQIRSDWCKDNPRRIYGVLSRIHTQDLLRMAPVGTFLFRFSENNVGCIALCYVDDHKSIVHSLIDIKQDTTRGTYFEMKLSGDSACQFETLSDLVNSCRPLLYLYPNIEKTQVFHLNDDGDEDDEVPH